MCEANVYLMDEDGKESLLLEMVDKVKPEKGRIVLENIFGQQKIVKAKIKEMALVEHKILLEKVLPKSKSKANE
ncbi:MAG: CooT family nickel-binding protein [Clostridia bacterium]|nr:CooT family nickel-binding protein [Clostridia bacterium]